jgi:uncharacterized membrane protein SpoIIM required for sporulation
MLQLYSQIWQIINFNILFAAIVLFLIGYGLAPTAHFKNIRWLTAYPFFIMGLMDKYFKYNWPAVKIFLIIFILNSCSLFINLLSAWAIITPFLFIIYLGINMGVIIYHSFNGQFYFASLLNPVAIFELPAAWISITMSIQFSLKKFFHAGFLSDVSFPQYIQYFVLTVLPLLFIAGIIEVYLIVWARRKDEK